MSHTAEAERIVGAEFPEKLACLFERWPYKSLQSGRGAGKSWSVADALLMLGFNATIQGWRAVDQPLRIVCARETQSSIAASVYILLCDRIKALGLADDYEIQEKIIRGRHPRPIPDSPTGALGVTTFIFTGLSDPDSLKSLEGADILWVEEAQRLSKQSWDIIDPTIRREGRDANGPWTAEVWLTWNPHFDTDETNVRFAVNPPPNAKCVTLSWRDNPWFPNLLEVKRAHMQATDPIGYQNIWEGRTRSAVEGAVFGLEIQAAMDAVPPRIGQVPRDRTKHVDTYWDLGHSDKTAIWFVQAVDGWYRLIDYLEDKGRTIEWYVIQLQNRNYVYGAHWVPHDAVNTIIHQKLASGDKSRSIEMILRELLRNVRIAPMLHVADRINAGRTIFPQCQFDQLACKDGLQALRRYQWGPVNKNNVTGREPLHNDSSHGADSFQTFAVCAKQPRVPDPPKQPRPQMRPANAWT